MEFWVGLDNAAVYHNANDEDYYATFQKYTIVYVCEKYGPCDNTRGCYRWLVSRIYCSRINPEEWDGWISRDALEFGPTPTPGK
jgi:hypothetical protein